MNPPKLRPARFGVSPLGGRGYVLSGAFESVAAHVRSHTAPPKGGTPNLRAPLPRRDSFWQHALNWWNILSISCASLVAGRLAAIEPATNNLPSLAEVLDSKTDLWGEAAMRQPNGASYEVFQNLLPPPRYVNADFHYYPIVLSAPNARVKARLISNGSGVNLNGGARSWNDVGTPVTFRVGTDEFKFGEIRDRLSHPTLAEGYLPIVEIRYGHASEVYKLEAFASTHPALLSNGVVFVRFSLASGTNGFITLQVDHKPLQFTNHQILDEKGQLLVSFDEGWKWERQRAHAKIGTNQFATVAIYTKPAPGYAFSGVRPSPGAATSNRGGVRRNLDAPGSSGLAAPGDGRTPLNDHSDVERGDLRATDYAAQRQKCITTWQELLSRSMQIETPEPLVNDASKNLLIQNFSLINGDRMNYSAGNQYEKMYAAESSDSALPLMWWGYEADMRRLLPVILDLTDKRLPHHFAAHKLDAVCRFYWQTRDADFVKAMRSRWQKELDLILTDRTPEHGLLSKENYCTDIEIPVYSFPANAACWAALRDLAPVLEELGDHLEAGRVRSAAADFKKALIAAVEKNERHETEPPFIPMALFHTEEIHDPITETRLGSYWDLVANYVIGSRLFAGTDRELWLPRYFEQHGGLCMGLTRSAAANHSFWTGKHRTNPLYGMRYNLDTLRRDDPERALVSFYGMLAHGMTRNTFIGAEGCSIEPLDEGGRWFYCPPNSSNNGQWLATLRNLLVQDWDSDEDAQPDTLRLLFATPRRWLEDGKTIKLERAPTSFGSVSVTIHSKLNEGEVIAELNLPTRNAPRKTLLRARVPEGWRVLSASTGTQILPADSQGTVDISKLSGNTMLHFRVAPR